MSVDFPSYRGQMEYRCLGCGRRYPGDSLLYTCPDCGGVFLLQDVRFDSLKEHDGAWWRDLFDKRLMSRTTALRGVFTYYELMAPMLEEEDIVYLGEAHTPVVAASGALQDKVGCAFAFKNDGQNHRHHALGNVAKEREHAPAKTAQAGHVGGARVVAAGCARINPAEGPADDEPPWSRA